MSESGYERIEDVILDALFPEVDLALPGEWSGVASAAGWGTWSVHWREVGASGSATESPD